MQCASLLREAMWGMVSKLHLDNPGIDYDARDHDVQLYKQMVYEAFVERIKRAFPEADFTIDTFTFGLDREPAMCKRG